MTQQPGRATGETHGAEQEPVEAGERDATQREQAMNEGAPAHHDPATPTQGTQDQAYGQSPDAAYGQREGQAEDPTDLGQAEIGESEDSEPVVTGG